MTRAKVEMYGAHGGCLSLKKDGIKDFEVEIYEIKNGRESGIPLEIGDTFKVTKVLEEE
jgi:hypothetical protein